MLVLALTFALIIDSGRLVFAKLFRVIANVSTWTYTGYNMVILYAALRSIPTDLHEAATVDGSP